MTRYSFLFKTTLLLNFALLPSIASANNDHSPICEDLFRANSQQKKVIVSVKFHKAFKRAESAFQERHYKEVIEHLKNVIDIPIADHGPKLSASIRLAKSYLKTRQAEKAIPIFFKILELKKQMYQAPNAFDYIDLSSAFYQIKDFHQALLYADKALNLEPNHKSSIGNKVRVLIKLENYTEATKMNNLILARFPEDRVSLAHKARIEFNTETYDEALKTLSLLIPLEKNRRALLSSMDLEVQVLIQQHKYQDALEKIKTILAIDPRHKHTLNFKAFILLNLGRTQEAYEVVTNSLTHHHLAHDSNGLDVQSSVFVAVGAYDKAIPLLHQLLEMKPHHQKARVRLVKALLEAGSTEEAQKIAKDLPENLIPSTLNQN